MAQSLKDYFASIGINVDVDENIFDTPAAKRAATIEELKKHSFGKDRVSGEDIYMKENQAAHLYNTMYDKHGNKINGPTAAATSEAKTYMDNDFKRSQGIHAGAGGESGYSMGFRGYRMASRKEVLKSLPGDVARATGENFLNSLGIANKQQREQFRSGGLISKAGALLGPGLGAATLFSTIINGDDMYETMTFNMATAAGAAGFTAGNRVAGSIFKGASIETNSATGLNMLKGGKMRMAAGAVGGAFGFATGAALVGGAMWAASDLTSNKSVLASIARGYSKLSSTAGIEQNERTLTMRQQALQQLSQSAMNDRASLLGNEAAVLRGVL